MTTTRATLGAGFGLSPDDAPSAGGTAVAGACLHCGLGLPPGSAEGFCCSGCRAVYGLLHEDGLARYYTLRGGTGCPVPSPRAEARDYKWLEAFEARLAGATGATRIELDLQGIQCTACVWLLEALFKRHTGGMRVLVNPALGKVEMLLSPAFPLREYVTHVERFGYLFGPALKARDGHSGALLTRIGFAAAIAMNSMIFALPIYLGLREGVVYTVFRWLTFALSLASLYVGGTVFVRSAYLALRRGVLHMDVPIALGIVTAWGGSAWHFLAGNDRGSYFDTVDIFIALMLVGRWLQERMVERNRRFLLASDGVDGLLARRVEDGGAVAVVRCSELRAGDALLIAPGDLVPVEAALDEARASCSLDWIHGESAPRDFARGEAIPAGAFNLGARAITVRAATDFAASPLVSLLRSTVARGADAARATPWWQRLTRIYVVAVLVAAAGGFGAWLLATGSVDRALTVATAILVVTCPCAFGIATPLAYELTQAGLRRAGLFVRASGFLDRALAVTRVVFDKTGTLTTGVLEVVDGAALRALPPDAVAALYNIAVRSNHPKSAAVRRALDAPGERPAAARFDPSLAVEELAGRGLELAYGGRRWRLGAPAWAAPGPGTGGDAEGDLALSCDGALVAAVRTTERLREDARTEVARLARDGYEVWILSGDAPARVRAMAEALGVPAARAVGAMSPEGKAAWIRAHDAGDTVMIGDGINDALAVSGAHCSGTPAIDRPFMPAGTDFYFVTPGLRPVGLALRAARGLARVNRRNLALALGYNALMVGTALAGLLSPLACAVLMPVSSLSVLFATLASLSARSSVWRY